MLMCLGASLVGVLAFLRKSSLLGEALSHAAYPGVILGALASLVFQDFAEAILPFSIMLGATVTSLLAVWAIFFLQKKYRIRPDSALCFVLSATFGIGVTLASRIQFTHSTLYTQSLTYLYGQAATMTDRHIWIYGILAFVILFMVILFYKELEVIAFDRDYALSLGINASFLDFVLFFLITLATVVGIRSVGVVMMSAMLIAPAAAARQFTHSLKKMLVLSAGFGVLSGFLGTYFSVVGTAKLMAAHPASRIALPTGPMIVLTASAIALFALLFAKQRGLVFRMFRRLRFRLQCLSENLLKGYWRLAPLGEPLPLKQAALQLGEPVWLLQLIAIRLVKNGWMVRDGWDYRLTPDGQKRGAHVVRLHRLWELYLADYLGMGVERVHRSAEEMEHILTPEIEKELTQILKNPKFDPHFQPIPEEQG
jgi:manganese/zinc/iron transport system permease protein